MLFFYVIRIAAVDGSKFDHDYSPMLSKCTIATETIFFARKRRACLKSVREKYNIKINNFHFLTVYGRSPLNSLMENGQLLKQWGEYPGICWETLAS